MQNQIQNGEAAAPSLVDSKLKEVPSTDVIATDAPNEAAINGLIVQARRKVRQRTSRLGAKIALIATIPCALAAAPVLIYHPSPILTTMLTTLYIGVLGV